MVALPFLAAGLALSLPIHAGVAHAGAPAAVRMAREPEVALKDRWPADLEEEAIAQAAGFYEGRMALLDLWVKSAPKMRDEIEEGRGRFSAAFGASFTAMKEELFRREPALRKQWATMVRTNIREKLAGKTFTPEEIKESLEGVTDPKMQPIDFIAMFCAFNPRYRAEPALQTKEGYFVFSEAPIAQRGQQKIMVQHPASWVNSTEKDQAGTLVNLSSNLGTGPMLLSVWGRPLSADDNPKDEETMKRLLDSIGGSGALKEREDGPVSTMRSGAYATRKIKMTVKAERPVRLVGQQFGFVREDVFVVVQFTAFAFADDGTPGLDRELGAILNDHEGVIDQVLTSMKLSDAKGDAPAPDAPR